MAIDVLSEEAVLLTAAAKLLPGRPHISTLWRWHRHGVAGVRLETVVIGGKRYTSRQALQRFIEATTAAHDGPPPAGSSPDRKRRAAIARAERELDKAGI